MTGWSKKVKSEKKQPHLGSENNLALPSKLRFPCKLTLQFVSTQDKNLLPRVLLNQWIKATLLATGLFTEAQLTLRFVDKEEGQVLNRDYRGKDYATNVLTFAYTEEANDIGLMEAVDKEGDQILYADIVLCSPVVLEEAKAQNKSLLAHYAHLIIHGVLHAQGYDHEHAQEAEKMEALEIKLLNYFDFPNPY